MVIREIDDELEKEVNSIETYLLVSFETEKDTLLAIEDIKKKYECIAYHTLESDTCNVIIPASKNGTQLLKIGELGLLRCLKTLIGVQES